VTDDEFSTACDELARLAELVQHGSPEQISANADGGWWAAYEALGRVYNGWIEEALRA
jgi:hypothetical protein